MKKVLVLLLILCMCLPCLAACDTTGGEDDTVSSTETSAEETDTSCNHELVSHEAQEPTCTVDGWDAYEACKNCSYTTIEIKPKLGHDEIAHEAKNPTSEEAGWYDYVTCSRCDYSTYLEIVKPSAAALYDRCDIDAYMQPLWSGNIVNNETVMIMEGDTSVPLLYSAEKIISVRSYDLTIEYVEGVDYKLEDGQLVILPGTRIPVCPLSTYYPESTSSSTKIYLYVDGKPTLSVYGEGTTMTRWQVAVTYKHSDVWEGDEVKSYAKRYQDFIKKLEDGEDVTVFFYGDSITNGAVASDNTAPYTPKWPMMFCQYVAKQYGYTVRYIDTPELSGTATGEREDTVYGTNGTITYINPSVGGWTSVHGENNFATYVTPYIEKYGCDLAVIAFGMNHPTQTSSEFCTALNRLIKKFTEAAPDSSLALISTMEPNPQAVPLNTGDWCGNGTQRTFEARMIAIASQLNYKGTPCAVVPMTSVSLYINRQKRFRDSSANNINHPNDFLVRAYAQTMFQTIFGYESLAEEETAAPERAPELDVNYAAMIGSTYLDGAEGTENLIDAVCVRFEETDGGYYLYHVVNYAKVYVNVTSDGKISYSDTAQTVWTYDTTVNAMVTSDADGLELVTVPPEICLHTSIIIDGSHHKLACDRCGVETDE